MKREFQSAPLLGGSSLLTIFGVLCLTVFALLSLTTVTARARLSESALSAVTAYYAADAQAEEIFARLRNGETVAQVEREGNVYRYECPITPTRSLFVEVEKEENNWRVCRWQEVSQPLKLDDSMPVWDGK